MLKTFVFSEKSALIAISMLLGSCSGFNLDQGRVIERPQPISTRVEAETPNSSAPNRTEIPMGPADAPTNQIEGQKAAQIANLKIQWDRTEILEESGQHTKLLQLFTLNDLQVSTTSNFSWRGVNGEGNIRNCRDSNLPYEVDFNQNQTGPNFWAIGKTVCLIDGFVHVGLDFFTWNSNGMISEKVLLNISEAELASLIVKEFSLDNNRTFLLDWVRNQTQ